MEGPPVLGPCPWQKRHAWARQSRGCRSPGPEQEEEEEEEEEAAAVPWDTPEPPPHLDDAVLAGSPRSKIRAWLQDCGAAALEEPGLPKPCACGSSRTSFEDDLSLGAEALLLPGSHQAAGRTLQDGRLSLGHSTASSVPSGVPSGVPSSSSLSEVLAWWHSDAEEILHDLGFVGTDPGVASRVPLRFFSAPSRASGIDLGLFLRAQLRRLETEDPCLLLASRFQQVQALAVTADAFFCLYSHVSRTPLRRIAPPRPYRDIPDSPDSPAPPGQRLKRAVSSLCLYTGGDRDTARGSREATGTGGPREHPGGVPEGWRRDGDTGTVQRGPSPRPAPVGTPAGTAWGHPERSCPHGRGVWGPGGAPCPAGAAQGDTRDPRPGVTALWGNVTVSPALGQASRVGVPSPLAPRGAAESFELEEVLSEAEEDGEDDEDEDDEDDVPEEAARSPHPSARTRRSSLLHGRSDSSGFGEEPVPASVPALSPPARPRGPDWVT